MDFPSTREELAGTLLTEGCFKDVLNFQLLKTSSLPREYIPKPCPESQEDVRPAKEVGDKQLSTALEFQSARLQIPGTCFAEAMLQCLHNKIKLLEDK